MSRCPISNVIDNLHNTPVIMSRTTTALVVSEFDGPFDLKEICLDEIRPDEALVELHASGICYGSVVCKWNAAMCAPCRIDSSFQRWNDHQSGVEIGVSMAWHGGNGRDEDTHVNSLGYISRTTTRYRQVLCTE